MQTNQVIEVLRKLIDTPEEDFETLKDEFFAKYLIDIHNASDFGELLKDLLAITYLGFDNDIPNVGFSDGEKWLASKEHESQFIFTIIRYLTKGETIPDGKGFARTIIIDGVPKYKVTIGKAD